MKNGKQLIDFLLSEIDALLIACETLESRGNSWRGLFELETGLRDLEGKAPAETVADIRQRMGEISSGLIRIESEIEKASNE